jgi:hypothetical protein
MAVYRQVQTTFWQDDFVLTLTPEEKYFYLYLLTNSKTKQCGIYELPKPVMNLETGYNLETIDKLLQKFINYQKILYNDKSKEVCLVNWLKYNPTNSPKIWKCVEKELRGIKDKSFVKRIYPELPTDTLSKGYRNNNNKKKNNKKNKDNSFQKIPFDTFWNAYDKKVGKKSELIEKWDEFPLDIQEKILAHIECYKIARPDKQYRKDPETYFNNESWNDEIIKNRNREKNYQNESAEHKILELRTP